VWITLHTARRFANWLNNGQGSASTETVPTRPRGTPTPSNHPDALDRNPGAIVFLTSENEWYKAAYSSPSGEYFDYPTGTNTPTVCALPTATANRANCGRVASGVTDVGAYSGSSSPWGTFDQGGNVWELIDTKEAKRGGGYFGDPGDPGDLAASHRTLESPYGWHDDMGFRVASLVPVPEPARVLLELTAVLSLCATSRRARASPRDAKWGHPGARGLGYTGRVRASRIGPRSGRGHLRWMRDHT
jgi:hypothetical protein